jgi:hypothetical protein
VPLWQYLSDAIPQHPPLTEAEVKRMRNGKREDIAWKVNKDGAVTFDREGLVTIKPSARRRCVAMPRIVDSNANRFDSGYAFCKLRSGASVVCAHNEGSTKTVCGDGLGIVGKHALNVAKRITTIRKQGLDGLFVQSS